MGRAAAPSGVARLWKWGAGTLSAAAALVSIISSVQSLNGSAQVHRIRVAPAFDTAFAVGDTLQLAATITDARGGLLPGVGAGWSSTDPSVAAVDSGGAVVALRGGTTTVVAAAGGRIAQSHILVRQRPAAIRILGDSLMRMDEGSVRRAVARVVDRRGQPVPGGTINWRSDDPSVAIVDGNGITAIAAGRATLTASSAEFEAVLPLEVIAVPASITLLGGDGQRAAVGRRLPQPVRVQVVSRSGRPMVGVVVRFGVGETADLIEPDVDTTDGEGTARADWILAGLPGRRRLAIGVEGIATPTLATAEADPVAANTRMVAIGEPVAGPAGEALAQPVGVRVSDSTGLPLADLAVAWTTDGGGTIEAAEPRTDSLGEAHARWVLGTRAGTQRAYLQVGGSRDVPRYTLRATALPGPAAEIAWIRPPAARGTVGRPTASPLALRVTDRAGNVVPGAVVGLAPASGSVPDSTIVADSAGRATFVWTLGRTSGPQRLRARIEGVDRVLEINVDARPGPPARLTLGELPDRAMAGGALPAPVTATLADGYGNPVAGEPVTFAPGAGRMSPARVVTDARGRASARWTLGPAAADQRLTATAVKGTLRATATVRAGKRRVSARPAP